MQKIKILKVKLDSVTEKEALEKVSEWLKGKKQRHIATPNPEILLEAERNPKFRKVLNQTDLNIPDGIGILWAAKFQKTNKSFFNFVRTLSSIVLKPDSIRSEFPERVTGTDLTEKICANTDKKVFFLGAKEGIAKKTAEKLKEKYKQFEIAGSHSGSPKIKDEKEIVEKINNAKAEILFVAYGAPAQELWIARNLKKLKTVKLAIGIGGAFDFVSGERKRAPKLMQKAGIEWLYRLLKEPKRIKRIYNATIKFPLKIKKC